MKIRQASLQWSRDLEVAESLGPLVNLKVSSENPSMEPRLGSRGKTGGGGPVTRGTIPFNGAATWKSRKGNNSQLPSTAPPPSMEPRLGSRGKTNF